MKRGLAYFDGVEDECNRQARITVNLINNLIFCMKTLHFRWQLGLVLVALVMAFVTAAEGATLDEKSLTQFLRERLAD